MKARATFKVKAGEEKPFGEVHGAPKLAKFNGSVRYEGDLEGEAVLSELKIYIRRKFAMIYGLERFKGKFLGKSGSFVFQRTGKFEDGVTQLEWNIVPHSGTGELKGLIGRVIFESGPAKEYPIVLDYAWEGEAVSPSRRFDPDAAG